MTTVKVNGQRVRIADGERLPSNVLLAAWRAGALGGLPRDYVLEMMNEDRELSDEAPHDFREGDEYLATPGAKAPSKWVA